MSSKCVVLSLLLVALQLRRSWAQSSEGLDQGQNQSKNEVVEQDAVTLVQQSGQLRRRKRSEVPLWMYAQSTIFRYMPGQTSGQKMVEGLTAPAHVVGDLKGGAYVLSAQILTHVAPDGSREVWPGKWPKDIDYIQMVANVEGPGAKEGVYIANKVKLYHVTRKAWHLVQTGEYVRAYVFSIAPVGDASTSVGVWAASDTNVWRCYAAYGCDRMWLNVDSRNYVFAVASDGSDGCYIMVGGKSESFCWIDIHKKFVQLSQDWHASRAFIDAATDEGDSPRISRSLVSDGKGGVYIMSQPRVSDAILYHVDAENRVANEVSSGWKPTDMSSDGAGGVFVITRGNLRHVTEDNKAGYTYPGQSGLKVEARLGTIR